MTEATKPCNEIYTIQRRLHGAKQWVTDVEAVTEALIDEPWTLTEREKRYYWEVRAAEIEYQVRQNQKRGERPIFFRAMTVRELERELSAKKSLDQVKQEFADVMNNALRRLDEIDRNQFLRDVRKLMTNDTVTLKSILGGDTIIERIHGRVPTAKKGW